MKGWVLKLKKFKLGIITDEVSQNLDEVIELAQRYRLETLELRSVNDRGIHLFSDDEIDAVKAKVEAAGLTVCALSAPIFKCDLDKPEEIEQHFAIAARAIEVAHRLGAKFVRGFSFWAKEPFEQALPLIVEQLRKMARLFEEAGLTFVLEFDPSVYASNGRKVRILIDQVGSPNVQALFDPGNDLWDPDGEVPYPDGYEHLKGKIAHIHLKDAVRKGSEIEGVAIGSGEVDYASLFRRLVEDEYDGYLIVETHYRLTSKLTEEQLKRPSGSSFSIGGKEATEECLDIMYEKFAEYMPEGV